MEQFLIEIDWVGLVKAVFAPFVAVPQWVMLQWGVPKEFGLFALMVIGVAGFAFMSVFKGWIRWVCLYAFLGSTVTVILLIKQII